MTPIVLGTDARFAAALGPELEKAGLRPTPAGSAAAALEAVRAEPSVCLCTPRVLQGDDGSFASALRELRAAGSVRSALLLPPGGAEERERFADAFDAILVAPVKPAELVARLAALAPELAGPARTPGTAAIETTLPAGRSLAATLFDAASWPAAMPGAELLRAALAARATHAAGPAAVDATALASAYQSLSGVEVRAILVASGAPLPPARADEPARELPASDVEALANVAVGKLLVACLVSEADALRTNGHVEVDASLLARAHGELEAASATLGPLLERALRADPERVKDYTGVKASFERAVRELENTARRLRGEAVVGAAAGPLDEALEVAPQVSARPDAKSVARVTIEDAPAAAPPSGRDRRALIALAVVAALALVVHALVLDTFGLFEKPAPLPDPVRSLPGVLRAAEKDGAIFVTVTDAFPLEKAAPALAAGASRPIIVVDESGQAKAYVEQGETHVLSMEEAPAEPSAGAGAP